MTFEEAVDTFRAEETIESVLVLLGKDEFAQSLCRVALAWRNCTPNIVVDREYADDEEDLWESLWSSVEFDLRDIARISGTGSDCKDLFHTLKGYRLVYPDGTLSTVAKKALLTMAKTELGL